MKRTQKTNPAGIINKSEVAAYFGKSLPWIEKAVTSGLIPPPLFGNTWSLKVIERWIARLEEKSFAGGTQQ